MKAMIKLLVVLAMIILMAGRMLAGRPSWGQANRDVDDNGELVMDRLFYIDANHGINANFDCV